MRCAIVIAALVAVAVIATAAYYRRLIRIYARALSYEQRKRPIRTHITHAA